MAGEGKRVAGIQVGGAHGCPQAVVSHLPYMPVDPCQQG